MTFNVDFKLLYSLCLSTKYKSKAIIFSSDIYKITEIERKDKVVALTIITVDFILT